MSICEDGDIIGSDEIEEMYEQICRIVKSNDIICEIVKYSAAYTYMYRSVNVPENLDKTYIDKIGVDNLGRVSWNKKSKNKTMNQLWELIKPYISENIDESLELSGYNNFKNIICKKIFNNSLMELIYSKINFHTDISDFQTKYDFVMKLKQIFGTSSKCLAYSTIKLNKFLNQYLEYLNDTYILVKNCDIGEDFTEEVDDLIHISGIDDNNKDIAEEYFTKLCWLETLNIDKTSLQLIKNKLDNLNMMKAQYDIDIIKNSSENIAIGNIFTMLTQIIEKTSDGRKLIIESEVLKKLQKVPIDDYYKMVNYLHDYDIDFTILKNLYASKIINHFNNSPFNQMLKNYIFKHYLKTNDEFYNLLSCSIMYDTIGQKIFDVSLFDESEYSKYIDHFSRFTEFYGLKNKKKTVLSDKDSDSSTETDSESETETDEESDSETETKPKILTKPVIKQLDSKSNFMKKSK
jgi:hypothetical protein